jgi:hypothetical protein
MLVKLKQQPEIRPVAELENSSLIRPLTELDEVVAGASNRFQAELMHENGIIGSRINLLLNFID